MLDSDTSDNPPFQHQAVENVSDSPAFAFAMGRWVGPPLGLPSFVPQQRTRRVPARGRDDNIFGTARRLPKAAKANRGALVAFFGSFAAGSPQVRPKVR